ncbi:DNA mismatch repair endonuclease MutL [Paratissierella segnis]|jgi:DNA mismatch repair protein MutL|uniref:DNA mismatch repair protein MutL n=1 Tax=Paratissierella segnis TaxID=2763679 RepID=A0A926EUP2_9FIRM|nr:DNA mismatch repair endonuclease MutL [Paratissierella segnis]MBC8589241.1 DNA mismatch repair endonuclease MutL [Paratissierella segnis]
MGKIKILDNITIQKIAAGEVIERPSSVVKELIENSIDANARSIVVEIKNGGKTFIRVTDDGDGIDEEDLPLAFKRHSTSKLNKIDDLYNMMTLGFRGEALASISSVARLDVLTKTSKSAAGIHAQLEDGEIKSMEKVGSPKGTTIIVKDLFYNLPVRKKFLKSDTSESNSISDIVNKLALGNFKISFKFIKDNKVIINTIGNVNSKEIIYTILGKDIVKGLIPIEYRDENIELNGFISNNNLYRSNRSHQYLYINGRYITNYPIAATIEGQYRSAIPINRYPIFILYLKFNPEDLDVNIHPTKQEVKFVNNYDINGIIGNIIKKRLFDALSVGKFEISQKEKKKKEELQILSNLELNTHKNIIVKDFTTEDDDTGYMDESLDIFNDIDEEINAENSINLYKEDEINENEIQQKGYKAVDVKQSTVDDLIEDNKIDSILSDIIPIGIVFNTYIIAENKEKNKIIFIDQHAAHERVMYERYRNEYKNEKIYIQQLLTPEIIQLTNSEMNNLKENLSLFLSLGFELEEFGPNTIAIRGVPFIFGSPKINTLFMDILDNLDKDISDNYELNIEKIMKLACTSAIKGGDKISDLEINSLLKDLRKCENPYTCPHGRPTILEMTKKDLEKQFLRII